MSIDAFPHPDQISLPSAQAHWRKRMGLTGFIVAFALNVALAAVSALVLGDVLGWLAPNRASFPALIGYGLPVLQFVLFGYLLDHGFRFFVRRMVETQAIGRPPPRLGIQLGRVVIYFCILATTVSQVFNQSITGILAASGVVGLVMGFALRGLVSDLFFGIALHIDRNIGLGDWIDFSYRGRDFTGQLQDIHWRSVVLQDINNNVMLIPNSEFASAIVINRSKPGPTTEYSTAISLGNEYDCGRVMSVLDMALHHLISEQVILPDASVQIAQIDGGVIKYRLTYATHPGRTAAAETQSAVLKSSLQFLRAAGIYLYPLFPNYTSLDKLPPDWPQSRDVRLRVLASVPLLRVLSPQALEWVADAAVGQMCTEGSVLIQAGEHGNTMWVIAEGVYDVIVEKEGIPSVVATLWPGDWMGEMALLTGEPRTATIQARTANYVYAIQKPVMEKVFEADPELINVLAQIAGRRRKAREKPFPLLTPSQELARTKSTIARIREFFGMQVAS